MSRKHKNIIDIYKAIKLFNDGYGLDASEFNYYQIRIRYEESDMMWDWYHTTGSLVENRNGQGRRVGGASGQTFMDAESVALLIKKNLRYERNQRKTM